MSFRMVPDWLVESTLPDAAVRLYCALAKAIHVHGDTLTHEQIATAGGRAGTSGVAWVRKYMPLLCAAGAVVSRRQHRGWQYQIANPRGDCRLSPVADSPPVSTLDSRVSHAAYTDQPTHLGGWGGLVSPEGFKRDKKETARARGDEPWQRPIIDPFDAMSESRETIEAEAERWLDIRAYVSAFAGFVEAKPLKKRFLNPPIALVEDCERELRTLGITTAEALEYRKQMAAANFNGWRAAALDPLKTLQKIPDALRSLQADSQPESLSELNVARPTRRDWRAELGVTEGT